MKGIFLALCLLVPLAAAAAPEPAASIDPPPGWSDVTGKTAVRGVILALKGPEASSFLVARMPSSALDSALATRSYLAHALAELSAGAGMTFVARGGVETKRLRNGLTLRILHADLNGAPRLIVAVVEGGGAPLLATLSSAAPDAMLTPLFEALKVGAAALSVRESGVAVSLDGQLQVSLGGGLRSRDLAPSEKRQGVVLSIQGAGSEVLFMKIEDQDSAPKDEAAIVRAVVTDAAKVRLSDVSPARRASTPAGPEAVYAWAKMPGSPDMRFAAGYLPWAYWGYSILGRGPQADELMLGALAALKMGPSGVPKLLAATPRLEIPPDPARRGRIMLAMLAAACGGLSIALIAWSRGRKNANLPS
jgi:hypothetical protein